MKVSIKKLFILMILSGLLAAGCMTERVQPVTEYRAIAKQSTFMTAKIAYDEHGRPVFGERLSRRPGSAGALFTVIHAVDNRPVRAYDIAVVEQPRTGPGPLAVVYEWTGKGFEGGVAIAEGFFPYGVTANSSEDVAIYLAIKTAPIVIATVTGFVVGVIASIPETATELKRVVMNTREILTGSREFIYDDKGRIRLMMLYPPVEHAEALVRTEFFYEGTGDIPERTEVTSLAEKKVRVVR